MEPIATSINGAAKALSLGRTSIYALIKEGRLETVKLDGSKNRVISA
ncbi:hypothetical protein [Sphingobium sp.]|nr:hypothetical protein [Sphingobium sp.]